MLSFLRIRVWDILDILVVSALIFYFLTFLRGTRAGRMVYALLFIFIFSFIVRSLEMRALGIIIDSLKAVWVVVFVIIFQPEIRNALSRFGRLKFLKFLLKEEVKGEVVKEIIEAVEGIRERKFGALIVLEQEIGLKEFVESGIKLETKVSSPLLITIFTPNSPLHDGACIIAGDTILAARCTLPLSDALSELGMRHRAGLGITEISDALAIIVSEERQTLSLAYKGKIYYNLEQSAFISQIKDLLKREEKG